MNGFAWDDRLDFADRYLGLVFFNGYSYIVRPTQRALVERLGKYSRFRQPGFAWIIPVVERLIKVNVTEMMVNAEPQTIITKDKLNAQVDAQVYCQGED